MGNHRAIRVALGVAAGALGGLLIARWGSQRGRMPHLRTWQRALAWERGEVEAALFASRVQTRYETLRDSRPRFGHPALRFHLDQNILPSLALYHTLCEETEEWEAVLAQMETLFEVAFGSLGRVMRLLAYVPDPFRVFRKLAHWGLRLGFPPQGWGKEPVEDTHGSLALNVHRCFYVSVLGAYGAPELTSLFCRMDDLTYGALPSCIAWQRTKTLGRGGECCDFRWSRVPSR